MTTTTITEFMPLARSRSGSLLHSAFDSVLEPHHRRIRRHAGFSFALSGGDRWDTAQIERQSLFETVAPERR